MEIKHDVLLSSKRGNQQQLITYNKNHTTRGNLALKNVLYFVYLFHQKFFMSDDNGKFVVDR